MRLVAALLFGTSLALSVATARAQTFNIDPAHTTVAFLVNHLGYSNMLGRFNTVEGEFELNEGDPAASKVSVKIMTESVDTNHAKRDEHLRSPDFFNSAEFPEMTFVSTSIEKTGDNSGTVTGDLTLLGVTKAVTMDVEFNKKAEHPLPQYNGILTAGFSARGKLKRSDYGMKYALGGIGDEIELIIEAEGAKK